MMAQISCRQRTACDAAAPGSTIVVVALMSVRSPLLLLFDLLLSIHPTGFYLQFMHLQRNLSWNFSCRVAIGRNIQRLRCSKIPLEPIRAVGVRVGRDFASCTGAEHGSPKLARAACRLRSGIGRLGRRAQNFDADEADRSRKTLTGNRGRRRLNHQHCPPNPQGGAARSPRSPARPAPRLRLSPTALPLGQSRSRGFHATFC